MGGLFNTDQPIRQQQQPELAADQMRGVVGKAEPMQNDQQSFGESVHTWTLRNLEQRRDKGRRHLHRRKHVADSPCTAHPGDAQPDRHAETAETDQIIWAINPYQPRPVSLADDHTETGRGSSGGNVELGGEIGWSLIEPMGDQRARCGRQHGVSAAGAKRSASIEPAPTMQA